ncbi:MAG: hypothetical protein FWF41_00715 [Betaproteobacteria bacterium]|nr:hypothetical protein [Betaproteobacteria bacterium]
MPDPMARKRVQENATPVVIGDVSRSFLTAYTRQEGECLITVIGKAPNDTLRLIAQGLVRK